MCFNSEALILSSNYGLYGFWVLDRWTFTLLTIYFGFGSLLSIFGCYWYHKIRSARGFDDHHKERDAEYGPCCEPLIKQNGNMYRVEKATSSLEAAGFQSYLFQVMFQEKDVEEIRQCLISGYESCYWTCSVSKLGYSGTAIISRIKPLSVRYGLGISDHDSEGRLVTAEFDSFYLICGYVPNSGDGLKRLGGGSSKKKTLKLFTFRILPSCSHPNSKFPS